MPEPWTGHGMDPEALHHPLPDEMPQSLRKTMLPSQPTAMAKATDSAP